MQHSKLAARFYRCPTAGKYLLAAAKCFPGAHLSVQHAYAMHVYARQSNAGGWRYFKATGYAGQQYLTANPNVAAWKTIRLATLQQYVAYVKPCQTLTRGCIMAWHLHQQNMRVHVAIWQAKLAAAKLQAGNNCNWYNLAKQQPAPIALKQQLLRTRAQKQRYYAAWLAANQNLLTEYVVAPQWPQLALA